MNFEKVSFAFFIVFALTLNFGFFTGEIDNPAHHHVYELFAAIIISLIATVIKLGDRSHIGAVLLATSLVADIHLLGAAIIWGVAEHVLNTGVTPDVMSNVVSVSGGALIANITSVVLLVVETVVVRR